MEPATVLAVLGLTAEVLKIANTVFNLVRPLSDQRRIEYDVRRHLYCMRTDLAILIDALEKVQERLQKQNIVITRGVQMWMDDTKEVVVHAQDLIRTLTNKYDRYIEKRKNSSLYRMFSFLHKPFSTKRVRDLMFMEERVCSVTKHACTILQLTYQNTHQQAPYQQPRGGCSCFGI